MIVDDHPLMRRGFSDAISEEPALEVCGEAASADAAWELLESLNPPPELMIVDLALPGMSGLDLATHIRRERPELKILFMSGFVPQGLMQGTHASEPFLAKPFSPDQISRAVEEALNG